MSMAFLLRGGRKSRRVRPQGGRKKLARPLEREKETARHLFFRLALGGKRRGNARALTSKERGEEKKENLHTKGGGGKKREM